MEELIFYIILAIIGFCSFLLANKIHTSIKSKNKMTAVIVGVLVFTVSFVLLYFLAMIAFFAFGGYHR